MSDCKHERCSACHDSVYCCRCCGFEHDPRTDSQKTAQRIAETLAKASPQEVGATQESEK